MAATGHPGRKAYHKYGAVKTENDGIVFASKAEARRYTILKILVASGEVIGFLRQVPVYLPGGTRYVCDFQIFYADGRVVMEDVKGMETAEFKIKWREVQAAYPWMTFEIYR